MVRSDTARRLTAVALALGLFGTLSVAQPPRGPLDPLAEAQARQRIANQKAETEVLKAIQDADRLAKISAVKAARVLKSAQIDVDLSPAISGDTRKNLMAMIEAKLAQIEGRAIPNPGPKLDPIASAVKYDKKAAYETYTAELKAVNDGIQRVIKFKQAALTREAEQEIASLGKSYPNNPSVIRLQEQGTIGSRVDDALEFARQQDKRITLALNDVARSSLPAKGDIEFPPNWREKDSRKTQVQLTAKEKKIIEALNKPVTVSWSGKMLEEALQELSNTLDQNLFLDKKSLNDLGIDLSRGVNLQANGVTARTVLRQLLGAQGLTFVVKDEVIQVVTVEKARDLLVTRVYYLGDVVRGVGPVGGSVPGSFLDFQQTMQNADMIVKSIQSSVDPLCWKANGGPCTITFHYPTMSIIVRASAEVHSSIGTSIGGR